MAAVAPSPLGVALRGRGWWGVALRRSCVPARVRGWGLVVAAFGLHRARVVAVVF
jgi:hypothetical protein